MFKGDADSARNSLDYNSSFGRVTSIFTRVQSRRMPWLRHADYTEIDLKNRIDESPVGCGLPVRMEPWPKSKPFRTKHITAGWDFRDEGMLAVGKGRRKHLMEGNLFQNSKEFKRKFNRRFGLPDDYGWPFVYELLGKGGFVGAWGFVNKNGWEIENGPGELFHRLFWWSRTKGKKVGSDDFGNSLDRLG